MKIVEYDAETYAILIKKRQLENAGFRQGEDVYVVTLEKGMLAILRKSSFKEQLKETIKSSIRELDSNGAHGQVNLSGEEMAVLTKILSVRFEERVPERILSSLTQEETAILKTLVDKGILSVYKGGKYSEGGVYTIPREIYGMVKEQAGQPTESEPHKVDDIIKSLNKEGFAVVDNDDIAKNLSYLLRDKIKSGAVKGIRGFDSKYYIFASKKYDEVHSQIERHLRNNGHSTLSEISKGTKIDEVMCKGVLAFMLENSDIIEKSRGRYELV